VSDQRVRLVERGEGAVEVGADLPDTRLHQQAVGEPR